MIWSVSTLARSSGATLPVWMRKGCISVAVLPVPDVHEMSGNGGGGGHGGTDEVGAPARALAAFEIAVAGGGASLQGLQDVGVHAQAHGATGFAPLEAGLAKYQVELFFFRCLLYGLGAGHDHGCDLGVYLMTFGDTRGGAQILQAGIG